MILTPAPPNQNLFIRNRRILGWSSCNYLAVTFQKPCRNQFDSRTRLDHSYFVKPPQSRRMTCPNRMATFSGNARTATRPTSPTTIALCLVHQPLDQWLHSLPVQNSHRTRSLVAHSDFGMVNRRKACSNCTLRARAGQGRAREIGDARQNRLSRLRFWLTEISLFILTGRECQNFSAVAYSITFWCLANGI